jgi:hypothetical protein
MRIRRHRSPLQLRLQLLLLLLPALTAALAIDSKPNPGAISDRLAAQDGGGGRADGVVVGTKDAPVDGLDGKPHAGPFVESTKKKAVQQVEDLKTVAGAAPGRSSSSTSKASLDGFEVPEDDGVMSDLRDRERVKGPTGTEGGVSQKDRERKEKGVEGKKPDPPKEAPPLPAGDKSASKVKEGEGEAEKKKGAAGLEVS